MNALNLPTNDFTIDDLNTFLCINCNLCLSVGLFVCPIITQKPLDPFSLNLY